MRNLKKILALVLALVMSLSLMATASATDFKDDANVGETYRVAVDVLSDLSVFGGDQNGNFNPQDPIRRSEVAAIIYRIATGDTGSEGHKSYTPYNQFADVVDGSWYAGYVTYCANAGYIKGRNDGNFHPNDNVTGYEVLAMILRAVGYDKNNEFVGSNWQTNTASIATQRGVLKNLTGTTLLSQPATREVVAELLFRSIMLQQVTWNANSLSYSDNGATLAKQNLNMEAVTGVVMGNERGNLEGTSVLAEGKTSLLVNGETSSRTLNVSTDLTVIGESRSAYIQGSKVLGGLLEDAGNDVKDNEGAETTVEKLRGGLNVKDAQHFENFADEDQDTSEWLIRYVVENSSTLSSAWVDYFDGLSHNVKDKHHVVKLNAAGAIVDYSSTEFAAYEVSIQPDTRIPATDKNIMKAIFSTANRTEANPSEKPVNGYVYGEVYVGTSSLEDKSDIMSWNKFVETYLVAGKVKPITEVGNGNWLKIIDNNGDGKAEYVLHTAYTLDEVADSATRNGTTTYFYNGIDSTDYKFIYLNDYAPAVGDIVLYAVIDGTIQIHKADTAKGTFKAVNYKERQATDVNGDVKEQSDIYNYTRLPQILTSVNENVEYDLYLDDYGYVRAYNNKTSYALVTEVYNTNRLNQGWVTGRALTAEVAIAGENAIREYPVLNSSYYNDIHGWNPFYIGDGLGWNPIQNSTELNYLKPATHMLGTGKQGNEFIFDDNYFNNPVNNERRTWTNVAEYIMGENGINLYTAAKVRNEIYNEVDTDYIQLDIRDISAKDPLYVIDDDNYPKTSGDASAQDNYVRAVDDTQFFAVDKEGHVRQWVGYRNTLTLDADVNNIHAMYAVATNTNANRDDKTYWVADVIVIEVEKFDSRYESISLIYSNNTKISGDVKYLQALDNAKGEIGIIPNNVNIWNGQFTDYGFYGLTNIKVYDEENKLYTADINRIHSASGTNHADGLACGEDYGIYFGVVRSRLDENYYSDYITADVLNNKGLVVEKSVTLSLADFGGAYSITKGGKNYTDNRYNDANWMTLGGHASNRVDEGDYILWAEAKGNSSNKVGFIVDISDKTVRTDRSWENADFIGTVAAGIANEQTTTPVDPVEAAKTAAVNALNVAAEAAKAGLDKDAPDYDAKVAAINAALEAALTKVNEADTAENVETAKTEGLKAIEEAKGDVPASEHTLTITIGENVVSVTVTVTPKDGEAGEPIVVTAEETGKEITVPNGAKVEFATETAPGYVSSESNETVLENVTAGRELNFTAVEEDTTDKAIFTLDPNGTIWFWSTLNAADRTKVDVVLAAAGKDYAVGDEIALADFINLPEGQKPSLDGDFDLEFAPAEAAHYDYDKDVIVVDQNEKITVTLMCYNDGWKSDIDWGEGEGEDDGTWNPDGSGSELPQSRVARSMAASEKASRPQKGDVIPFYFWYVPVGKVPVSVTVNGEAVPSDKIELAKDYGNRGSAWQVPVVFTGGNVELVIKLGELKPELAVEVVDGDKNAVPTEDYTLEKTERKVTSGGKVTYNYTYTLTILDTGKWAYNQYLVTDEAGTGMGTAGSATTKAGVTTFTVSGLNKDGKLTITLKKPAAVTVTVSDKVALSVDKTSLLKGTSVEDATLTLSLNEGYQDGYRLPRTIKITMGGTALVINEDYNYDGSTGVIKFLAGDQITDGITGDIVITANAIVEDGKQTLTVKENNGDATNFTYGPKEVTFGTEFTKLPVVKFVPKAGYAYPQSILSVKMYTADNQETTLVKDTDYTYDKTTGEFKFVGTKKVTGGIIIDAASAVVSVAKLNVSINENGVVVVAKADGNAPTPANTYYMLADKTGDATLIEDLESILNNLFQNPQPKATELSKLIRLEDTTKPALTEKDNDSYVLVIELDQAKTNAAAVVLSAGAVKVTGITNAEKPQSELEVSDKHLTATREGDVITITAKDAGYYAPSVAGNTKVFIDGKVTTANTDWNFRYDEATKSAIITLTTNKTGPVLIQVSAAELVRKLSVEIDIAGTVTIKDGDKTVAWDAATTFYVDLANNSMESQINALTNESGPADYLKAIGLGSTAGKPGAVNSGSTAWTCPNATDKPYVLVYLLSGGTTGNVVAAGIAKNNKVAAQPALDKTTTTILGTAISDGVGSAATYLNEVAASVSGTVDLTSAFGAFNSGIVVKATGNMVVESDFVFVPTYKAGGVNLASWDQLVASVDPAQHFDAINNLDDAKAIFGAGLDASCMKNGTLYIRVNEAANRNNVVYYAVAIEANASVAGDRNDAPVADGNVRVYVIADVKASQTSGVESIELFDGSNTKTMTVGTTAMNLVEYFDFASDSAGENVAKITLKGSSSLTNEKVTVAATPAIFVKNDGASGSSHVMEYKSDAISNNTTVDVTIALNS